MATKRRMNQKEYAAHRGISSNVVSKFIRQGKLDGAFRMYRGKYRIDPKKADELLDQNLDPGQRKKAAKSSETYQEAKTSHEIYKSKLAKHKLQVERGKYIEKTKVESDAFRAGQTIKNYLESVPVRVSAQISAIAPGLNQFDCQEIIRKEMRNILEDLSNVITLS